MGLNSGLHASTGAHLCTHNYTATPTPSHSLNVGANRCPILAPERQGVTVNLRQVYNTPSSESADGEAVLKAATTIKPKE